MPRNYEDEKRKREDEKKKQELLNQQLEEDKKKNLELRSQQLGQVNKAIADLEEKLDLKRTHATQLALLESVSSGLYIELDKLCKKAPAEPITELLLEQLNDVIRETKQLVVSDPYVQKLKEFIAAGDNPQQRDAIVVLRQLTQGLERYQIAQKSWGERLFSAWKESKGIKWALEFYLTNEQEPSLKDIQREFAYDLPSRFFKTTSFDFEQFNTIDIATYFLRNE